MAYALVTSTSAGSANANDVTTAGVNTTGATLIVLIVATNAGVAAPTPTDSKSNTWTSLTAQESGGILRVQLWYCASPVVGSGHTFSVSSGFSLPSIDALAFSGAAASPFDQQNGAVNFFASTLQPGSVTPSENNELLVTGFASSQVDASSIDSSFTLQENVALTGNHYSASAAYKIQTSAGAENPTWTASGNGRVAAAIATFKAAAATGNPWYAYANQRAGMLRERVERLWNRRGPLWVPDYVYRGATA